MRKNRGSSFRKKLFKSFMIVGILPLLLMTITAYNNVNRLIRKKINTSIFENVDMVGSLIDSSIEGFVNMGRFISYNEDIQNILNKKGYISYDERFVDIQKVYKITSLLAAAQKNEVPVYIVGVNKYSRFSTAENIPAIYTNMKGDMINRLKSSDKLEVLYTQRRYDSKNGKDIVMSIAREIRNKGNEGAIGYVILDIYDEYFDRIMKNITAFKGNNVYILDKDGRIITDKIHKNKTGFKFYDKYYDEVMNKDIGQFECNIDGVKNTAFFSTLKNTGYKIIEVIPSRALYGDRRIIVTTFIYLMFLFSIISIWVSLLLAENISKPVNKLSSLMGEVEKGNLKVRFDDYNGDDEIGRLGESFNKMVDETNRLINEVYVKQYLLKEAEFKALKSQVNPHFLYNTLEAVNWMAKLKDYEGVTSMVTALGKFLRYSMRGKGDVVTVREDIDEIKNYLTIQKIRYGDKININIDIQEEVYDKKILKFLIQPLVENAIIHGLEPKVGSGFLNIKGYLYNNKIYFDIEDNGVGFGKSNKKGNGMGIENVDRRAKIHYGEEYGITIPDGKEITCVRLAIPCEGDEGIG